MTSEPLMSLRPPSMHRPRALHATWLLLPCLLLVPGVTGWGGTPQEIPTQVTLFAFDGTDEAEWFVVNDGVMGGRSSGFVTVQAGTLRFSGTLVTRGGGFTSVRARRVIDLTGAAGLELRVRGDGRQYEVEVDDGLRGNRGNLSRRAPFVAPAEWTLVRVPFSALRDTVFGQAVNAPPIDLARIQGLGLYIADGRDGPFRLDVDFIRTYHASEE